MLTSKYTISHIILLVVATVYVTTSFFYYPKYKNRGSEALISWDISGYYLYLPAAFIYKDLKQLSFAEASRNKYQYSPNNDQFFTLDNGYKVMKYSVGMAVLYSPAFIVAHTLSPALGYDADGYALPYQLALYIQGLLVTFIGFWVLRKFLLAYFEDLIVAWTLLIIGLCTNLLEYGAITNAMSHNYLFLGYSLLLYLSHKSLANLTYGRALAIGSIIGLMALARPTEIISALIPLGYILFNKKSHTLSFLLKNKYAILLAMTTTLAIGSLQLVYWKYVSGDWFVYSYQEQSFSWLKPHLLDGIFSFRAGWLIYTPVMVLSLMGLCYLRKTVSWKWTVLLYTFLFIYIAYAWDIWWYGGSLGQRTMVQIYPVLALPMAAFISSITKPIAKIILTAFVILCGYYNMWLVHAAHRGSMLEVGNMTKHYLFATIGRKSVSPETKKLLDARYIHTGPRADTSPLDIDIDTVCLSSQQQNTSSIQVAPSKQHKFLRITVDVDIKSREWEFWKYTQLIAVYKSGERQKSNMLRLQRMDNSVGRREIYLDSKIPSWAEEVVISLWHAGSHSEVCIYDIKGEWYN